MYAISHPLAHLCKSPLALRQVPRAPPVYRITDARIESLRAAEAVTAYVIRILSGIDLAGRPEIAGRFATLYATEAKRAVDSLFQPNVRAFARRAN